MVWQEAAGLRFGLRKSGSVMGDAMYKLYWAENTGAFAPEVVMALAGTPYERVLVDWDAKEHWGAEFRRLNPMGQVPVMILPDGQVMTESAAMVLHIADSTPEVRLAPPPGSLERAAFDRWLFFMAVNLYGADLRYYYPKRFTAEEAGIAGVKQAAAEELERLFAVLDDPLTPGPFFGGERLSALDPYLLMLTDWYPPAQSRPAIARLRTALLAEPGVKAIWDRYQKPGA